MVSEAAFCVKEVFGPKGSVSIVMAVISAGVQSDDINAQAKTNPILRHSADMSRPDERIDMIDKLCERGQRYVLRAIAEDLDLSAQMNDGGNSLRIVRATDEPIHSGEVVRL